MSTRLLVKAVTSAAFTPLPVTVALPGGRQLTVAADTGTTLNLPETAAWFDPGEIEAWHQGLWRMTTVTVTDGNRTVTRDAIPWGYLFAGAIPVGTATLIHGVYRPGQGSLANIMIAELERAPHQ